MKLPIIQSGVSELNLIQTKWKSLIDPVLASPLLDGRLVSAKLDVGANKVNHLLNRKPIGWIIVGINGVANIYDTQASNQTPELTLNLTSSAVVTVNLWVF